MDGQRSFEFRESSPGNVTGDSSPVGVRRELESLARILRPFDHRDPALTFAMDGTPVENGDFVAIGVSWTESAGGESPGEIARGRIRGGECV